jgi:hypothetical protein
VAHAECRPDTQRRPQGTVDTGRGLILGIGRDPRFPDIHDRKHMTEIAAG